jgi:excisionase family DNA binding protein
MDTYTIAEAARLVGTSRGKLYQAIRAGHLQGAPSAKPGQVLRVTREALRTAGFPVPGPVAPDPARDTSPDTPLEPDTSVPTAEESVTLAPQSTAPDRALIAYLERALEQAQARELRLLDLLADLTRQRSAPQAPPAPGAPLPAVVPAAAARPPARPPLSGLRQQIVEVVRQHPEGIAPRDVRTLLAVDHDVRSTMKGMVRSGILTRRETGRYVVAAEGAKVQ